MRTKYRENFYPEGEESR